MASELPLSGFGISGYRSLTGEMSYVTPTSRVHLLAGENNAGKSGLLRVAEQILPTLPGGQLQFIAPVDLPQTGPEPLRCAIGIPVTDPELHAAIGGYGPLERIRDVFAGPSFDGPEGSELLWFEWETTPSSDTGTPSQWQFSARQVADLIARQTAFGIGGALSQMSSRLAGQAGQDDENARQVLKVVARTLEVTALPTITTIEAVRKIDAVESGAFARNGAGLIRKLNELQHPTADRSADRDRFNQITRFVQQLFGDPDASVEVPHDLNTLLIVQDGLRLPLDNYGTGLQQVVVLAAAATVYEHTLVCMEEPEAHLHPTLQRALLSYLATNTSNQYLIATHSPSLLDTAIASITSVHRRDGRTAVAAVVTPIQVAAVSRDLGARASDLVQANAVVWVEGPSDRTYIRNWITRVDDRLIEGVHYSIMFYGGGLIAHLAPDDPAVDDLIALPRLNRNFAIVLDSDCTGPNQELSETKQRIRDSIAGAGAATVIWITDGYTIENYLQPRELHVAVHAVHPKATATWDGDCWANPLANERIEGRVAPVSKAPIAFQVVAQHDHTIPTDARPHIDELVAMIVAANDLEVPSAPQANICPCCGRPVHT